MGWGRDVDSSFASTARDIPGSFNDGAALLAFGSSDCAVSPTHRRQAVTLAGIASNRSNGVLRANAVTVAKQSFSDARARIAFHEDQGLVADSSARNNNSEARE